MISLLLAILFMICGFVMLDTAAGIASRHGSSIWTAARPEGGAATIFLALAILFALESGGWL